MRYHAKVLCRAAAGAAPKPAAERRENAPRKERRYFALHRMSWAAGGFCCGLLLAEGSLLWPAAGMGMLALLQLLYRGQPAELLLFLLLALAGVHAMAERQAIPLCWQQNLGQTAAVTGLVRESAAGRGYLWLRGEREGTAALLCVILPDGADARRRGYPAGSRLQVRGRLALPEGPCNPGGFDEAGWYRGKGARYKLIAREITLLEPPHGLWRAAEAVRRFLAETAVRRLPPREAGLLLAVLLGERQRLAPEFYRLTQRVGVAHIFAVSGLHVGVVGAAALVLLRRLRVRAWLSLACLSAAVGFYCLLAALTPSVLRAAAMLLLLQLSRLLLRPAAGVDCLAAAALLILWQEPFLLWQAGFQLSFGVTLSLLLLANPLRARLRRWLPRLPADGLAVALVAFLGGLPITLWHFYRLSLFAPLWNLLLVPLVSALVPLALAAFCGAWLWSAAGWILFLPVRFTAALLLRLVAAAGALGGCWNVGRPSGAALGCYLLFLLLLFLLLRAGDPLPAFLQGALPALLLGALLCSCWLLWPRPPAADCLLYLDAGQGSCALLRTRDGETVVFDGGAREGELASCLAWYGINRVRAVVLSHGDADHIAGLAQLLETVPVQSVYVARAQLEREAVRRLAADAQKRGAALNAVRARATLELKRGAVHLAVYADGGADYNDRALTARLELDGVTAAFPGDLSLQGVRRFVADAPRIDVWTAPHHGSRASADAALYRQLRRKGVRQVVISAGRNNRYGHPHAETLAYLRRERLPWRTTQDGAVLLQLP